MHGGRQWKHHLRRWTWVRRHHNVSTQTFKPHTAYAARGGVARAAWPIRTTSKAWRREGISQLKPHLSASDSYALRRLIYTSEVLIVSGFFGLLFSKRPLAESTSKTPLRLPQERGHDCYLAVQSNPEKFR